MSLILRRNLPRKIRFIWLKPNLLWQHTYWSIWIKQRATCLHHERILTKIFKFFRRMFYVERNMMKLRRNSEYFSIKDLSPTRIVSNSRVILERGERKYLNLSTLMYDFIESCWYLILRAHMIAIWDNTLHEIGGAMIAMLYTFVLL